MGKKCEHKDVVPVFQHSAVCVDCGTPVCRRCRGQAAKPDTPIDKICSAFYWQNVIEANTWHGRALSREDAYNAYNSATLVCRYRAGAPMFDPC